jgi:hypothetical protein
MTLVCRPTPFVRFTHKSGRYSQTPVSSGTSNVGSLVLLPRGAYSGTGKHDSVVRVQRTSTRFHSFWSEQKWICLFRLRAALLLSLCLKSRALRRDLVKGYVNSSGTATEKKNTAAFPGVSCWVVGSRRMTSLGI